MARLTVEDLYNGDEYNIIGETFKDYWVNHQDEKNEITILFHLTVKHAIGATIKMIKQGDFIEDYESELKSLSLCLEVKK